MKPILCVALSLSAGLAAVPASAVVAPFASYTQVGTGSNVGYNNASSSFTTGSYAAGAFTPGAVAVMFDYKDAVLDPLGNLAASFSMTGATTGTAQGSGSRRDMALSGSFSFIYTGPTVSYDTPTLHTTLVSGANLLTGTFGGDNGDLGGTRGTQSAMAGDDTYDDPATIATNVVYSSDVLDFSNTINRSFGLTLTSVLDSLSVNGTNGRFNDFRASSVGTFSTDPSPIINGAVPEAATWAMMVIGFGAIGASLRAPRRSKVRFSI